MVRKCWGGVSTRLTKIDTEKEIEAYLREVASGWTDYLAEGQTVPLYWVGGGSDRIGLQGEVEVGHVEELLAGKDPERLGDPDGMPVVNMMRKTMGWEISFAPPKSVSVLWATGGKNARHIEEAMEVATREAIAVWEAHGAWTRKNGGWVPSEGMLAVTAQGTTNRNGDPQLHHHVVIANQARRQSDGAWRALDGTLLFGARPLATQVWGRTLRSHLSAALGVEWTEPTPDGHREIEGVPVELAELWSSRNEEINKVVAGLVAEAKAAGEKIHDMKALRMEVATRTRSRKELSETMTERRQRWEREAEELLPGVWQALQDLEPSSRWREDDAGYRLSTLVPAVTADLTERLNVWDRQEWLSTAARLAPDHIEMKDIEPECRWQLDGSFDGRINVAKWLVQQLEAEGTDQDAAAKVISPLFELPQDMFVARRGERVWTSAPPETGDDPLATDHERINVAKWLVHRLEAEGIDQEATAKVISDLFELPLPTFMGPQSQFREVKPLAELRVGTQDPFPGGRRYRPGGKRWTTHTTWEREQEITKWWDLTDRSRRDQVEAVTVLEAIDRIQARADAGGDHRLDGEQIEAITRWATGDTRGGVLIGPAGAGKTTAMRGVAAIARAEQIPVLGLAVSQVATEALADELGIEGENIDRFLTRTRGKQWADPAAWEGYAGWWIIDEASMVSTRQMAELVQRANLSGASLLAVGDHRQLNSVGAGGMFRTLAHLSGADTSRVTKLTQVRRMDAEWERRASLKLRARDAQGLYHYRDAGKVIAAADPVVEIARRVIDHMDNNKTVVAVASTNREVDDINDQVQQLLQARDPQEGIEVEWADPHGKQHTRQIRKGNLIRTRQNDYNLVTNRNQPVLNGSTWRVVRIDDGQIWADSQEDRGRVILDRGYLHGRNPKTGRPWVELAYASTVHAAQGRTVDVGMMLVSKDTKQETLYVGVTRGRENTIIGQGTIEEVMATALDAVAEPSQTETAIEHQTQIFGTPDTETRGIPPLPTTWTPPPPPPPPPTREEPAEPPSAKPPDPAEGRAPVKGWHLAPKPPSRWQRRKQRQAEEAARLERQRLEAERREKERKAELQRQAEEAARLERQRLEAERREKERKLQEWHRQWEQEQKKRKDECLCRKDRDFDGQHTDHCPYRGYDGPELSL